MEKEGGGEHQFSLIGGGKDGATGMERKMDDW
jgi:hypothetical protein